MQEYKFWVEGDNTEAAQKIRDIVQKWFGLDSQACIFFDKGLIFVNCFNGKNLIRGVYDISHEREGGRSKTSILLRLTQF